MPAPMSAITAKRKYLLDFAYQQLVHEAAHIQRRMALRKVVESIEGPCALPVRVPTRIIHNHDVMRNAMHRLRAEEAADETRLDILRTLICEMEEVYRRLDSPQSNQQVVAAFVEWFKEGVA